MIRIAIIEDESLVAQTLEQYIVRYAEEKRLQISVDKFSDGASFLDEYNKQFHIILMDIVMPHLDGMETAHRLRKVDQDVCLIFITSMGQYAIQGYEVSALDFIIKPVEYDLFSIKLEKAILHIKVDDCLQIPVANGMRSVRVSQVRFIESSKHYLYFHTASEVLKMRGSIRDIRQRFEPNGFALSSGSFLVNLSYIDQATKTEVIVDGTAIPIARTHRAEFWEKMAVHMSGGLLK